MSYIDELRISVVKDGLKTNCNSLIDAIDSAADYSRKLTNAQAGQNTTSWRRTLFNTADTGTVTLIIDATAKTVKCPTGAGLFANFRIGRDVFLSNFTTAANNATFEIIGLTDNDTLVIADPGNVLVNETDTTARARENPVTEELDQVTALVAVMARFTELQNAIDNTAVATADRRADLMNWVF